MSLETTSQIYLDNARAHMNRFKLARDKLECSSHLEDARSNLTIAKRQGLNVKEDFERLSELYQDLRTYKSSLKDGPYTNKI